MTEYHKKESIFMHEWVSVLYLRKAIPFANCFCHYFKEWNVLLGWCKCQMQSKILVTLLVSQHFTGNIANLWGKVHKSILYSASLQTNILYKWLLLMTITWNTGVMMSDATANSARSSVSTCIQSCSWSSLTKVSNKPSPPIILALTTPFPW